MLVFANCLESLILWRCRARSRVSCTEQRRRRRLELSAAQSNNINMAGEALNWELQMSSVGEMSIKCIFVCLKVLSWGEVRGGSEGSSAICWTLWPYETFWKYLPKSRAWGKQVQHVYELHDMRNLLLYFHNMLQTVMFVLRQLRKVSV